MLPLRQIESYEVLLFILLDNMFCLSIGSSTISMISVCLSVFLSVYLAISHCPDSDEEFGRNVTKWSLAVVVFSLVP